MKDTKSSRNEDKDVTVKHSPKLENKEEQLNQLRENTEA